MGLLEYLLERKNPGNVGTIETNTQPPKEDVSLSLLIFKVIVALLICCGSFYITAGGNLKLSGIIGSSIIMFIYCLISYHVIPKPDTSNVGLMGGLVDHPFKYTDDLNRFLIVLFILLYPGRFIATTFLQVIHAFKRH